MGVVPGWLSRRLRDATTVSHGAGRGGESVRVCGYVGGRYIVVGGGEGVSLADRQTQFDWYEHRSVHCLFILFLH